MSGIELKHRCSSGVPSRERVLARAQQDPTKREASWHQRILCVPLPTALAARPDTIVRAVRLRIPIDPPHSVAATDQELVLAVGNLIPPT